MRIVDYGHHHGEPARTYNVEQAIRGTLGFTGYDSGGQIEQLSEGRDRVERMLGSLIQILHETRVLTDMQVAALISYPFKVID